MLQLVFLAVVGLCLAQDAEICQHEYMALSRCLHSAQSASECPHGWTLFPKTRACYYMLPDSAYTFLEAEAACQSYSAHLASIHSATENRFASMLMEVPLLRSWQDLAWIGLKIENQNVSWTDSTPITFQNFLDGEPNPGRGIYGVMGQTELRSGLCKKNVD